MSGLPAVTFRARGHVPMRGVLAAPTVASLVRNVKRRLGVTTRTELVRAVRLAGEAG